MKSCRAPEPPQCTMSHHEKRCKWVRGWGETTEGPRFTFSSVSALLQIKPPRDSSCLPPILCREPQRGRDKQTGRCQRRWRRAAGRGRCSGRAFWAEVGTLSHLIWVFWRLAKSVRVGLSVGLNSRRSTTRTGRETAPASDSTVHARMIQSQSYISLNVCLLLLKEPRERAIFSTR